MTKIMPIKCRCSVCGTENEYRVILSTNTFGGGPDLDTRPGEMMRSTMFLWAQECPECGYVSKNVSDPSPVTRAWLKAKKYITCEGTSFSYDLAKKFYRQYLICVKAKKTEDAYFAILHAAWACDDSRDQENAVYCRKLAVSLLTVIIPKKYSEKENFMLMKADLMRRAGFYKKMLKEFSSVHFSQEKLRQILKFEIERAKAEDSQRYRVEDVIEMPS